MIKVAPPISRKARVLAITIAAAVLMTSLVLYVYSGCLQLVVASSNEKANILEVLKERYEPKRVERRCVEVTIVEIASGTAERALASDWKDRSDPRPVVWSPAATTWLLLLDEDRGLNGLPPIVPAVAQNIIYSPLVIAMLEPMARAMRQASQRIGWRDLVTLARDPAGWARFGGPWGQFKFAQTTPFISTSGLHAMISINNAAQVEAEPSEFVSDLDASVLHYADSVRTFLGQLNEADNDRKALNYMSAIAVEEKQVFDYNRGNPGSAVCTERDCGRIPNDKLWALYPRDGTLYADHPYAILDWQGQVDAELLQQAARDFLDFLEKPAQQDFFKSQGFRDHRKQAGSQLEQPYFDPNEPTNLYGVPRAEAIQQLRAGWNSDIRKAANALVLFDVHPSLARQDVGGATDFDIAKSAVVGALTELSEHDSIGLRTFPADTRAAFREVLEIAQLGPSPSQLAASVNGLAIERGTRSLYSAILAAADTVRTRYVADRVNAVVLVTNGGDESADRVEALTSWFAQQTEKRVLMFVVALPSVSKTDLDHFRAIVRAAGGILYVADETGEIQEMIRRALLNL